MEPLPIPFSYNWNNKLDCKALTTIRIYSPHNHVPDRAVLLNLKGVGKGTGKIKGVKKFYLADLNDYMAYIDTGYNKEECAKIIRTMYPTFDFANKYMAFILIVKD